MHAYIYDSNKKITPSNICHYCFFIQKECGKQHEDCYKAYVAEVREVADMRINIITRDGIDSIDTEQAPYKNMQIMNINCLSEDLATQIGEEIKIQYLREIPELRYIGGEQRSNWIDLYCAQDVRLMRGELRAIPLGVAMQLPKGYEAIMAPRSSTFKNYKILMVNSIGIIDESYCGDTDEWLFPAYATEDTFVPARTRIAQFRIVKHQPTIRFTTVDALKNAGRGGYGSTGKGVPTA